ncbi:hypothetical protein ACFSSC_07790 [Corynebacterium mendelii]|uniref:Hemophore-related protein n=1 Tax=Corynebacterium mendelii TaxID=2765362 RepID=A0A939IXS1_9CORY|nr:hypothetical protein [Corynebacterium mendelii]MBN9644765.1 hypothetical protein [Corynebacterium mendelii]
MIKKLLASTAAAAVLAAAMSAPATAADNTTPSAGECTAIEIAMLPLMGQAPKGPNGQLRFTESELRGKFAQKSDQQLAGLVDNAYASMLGSAKLSKDFTDKALACGLVKPDPKRDLVGSSEIVTLLTSVLGLTGR